MQGTAKDDHLHFSSSSAILDWLEKAIKISGLLALFGYMSLRAHFNFLGLSVVSTLSLNHYLMETYRLTSYLISIMAPIIAFVVLGVILMPRRLLLSFAHVWSSKFVIGRVGASIFAGLLLFFALRMLQLLKQYGTDVAVGKFPHADIDTRAGQHFCILVVIAAAIACLVVRHAWRNARVVGTPVDRASWLLIGVLLGVVVLQIPILYGYYIHSTDFPIASVTIGDDKSHSDYCGMILLDSGTDIYLWSMRDKAGFVQQIPRSKLLIVNIVGHGELFDRIRSGSATANTNDLDCRYK